jgi:hypothetical protein
MAPCNRGRLKKNEYELPKKVIELRLKLAVLKGRAALSNEIDWKRLALFRGFGLYNKYGTCHIWPVYSLSEEKIIQIKRRNTPCLCLTPLSSIYLIGRAWKAYMMVVAAGLRDNVIRGGLSLARLDFTRTRYSLKWPGRMVWGEREYRCTVEQPPCPLPLYYRRLINQGDKADESAPQDTANQFADCPEPA